MPVISLNVLHYPYESALKGVQAEKQKYKSFISLANHMWLD